MTFAFTSVRASNHSSREEGGSEREQKQGHKSVMVSEVMELLAPRRGEVVVDATYGAGGHSRAIQKRTKVKLVALDADPSVVDLRVKPSTEVITANFGELGAVLKKQRIKKVDKVLFDLGWRREQLGSGKGFSFQYDEPLLMSYGEQPYSGFFARDILNTWNEKAIADVLYGYGEERYARRIARSVVERRAVAKIGSTIELVEIIRDAVPPGYRHGKTHFATRSFQALRIAVNDELRALEQGLAAAWKHLNCDGRVVVVTFHSIEDRLVKRAMAAWAKKGGALLVKKPLTPSREEVRLNPAARSAKVRGIQKICNT